MRTLLVLAGACIAGCLGWLAFIVAGALFWFALNGPAGAETLGYELRGRACFQGRCAALSGERELLNQYVCAARKAQAEDALAPLLRGRDAVTLSCVRVDGKSRA